MRTRARIERHAGEVTRDQDAPTSDFAARVDRLESIEAIRQLAARYAVALDARDLDTLVELFVPDVRVGDQHGRDALRAFFDESLREVGVTILHVAGHVIDLDPSDPDRATGIVSCRGELELFDHPEAGGTTWVVQAIQYHDTYARTAKGWGFVRRRHLLTYGARLGDDPMTLPPANWPASQIGRGDLPESLPTWQQFWSPR